MGLLFPSPLCSLPKHEGCQSLFVTWRASLFCLKDNTCFLPGSPTARAAQSARKINQTSPERTAWCDRQLLQKNESLQASKAVPDQQQKMWALTFDQVMTLITTPNPLSTDVMEEPWSREDPCENMTQAPEKCYLAGERGKKCFINARSRIMQQKGEIFSLSGSFSAFYFQSFNVSEHFIGKI